MGRHLGHAMIAALLLLAVMSFGCSRGPSPQEMVSKAANVAAGVSSYRSNTIMTQISDGETTKWIVQSKHSAPGRHWDKASDNHGRWFETLIIDDKCYRRSLEQPQWHLAQHWHVISLKEQLESLASLKNLKRLPDQKINGVDCFHLSGRIIGSFYIQKMESEAGYQLPEPLVDQVRQYEMNCEVWIAKGTYLIRQLKGEGGWPNIRIVRVTQFYDFNKPVHIEAPQQLEH